MDEHDHSDRPAIIVTGGEPIDPAVVASLPADAWTIAADSGLDLAHTLGLSVDHVVGDMDSVEPATLDAARAKGATVEIHPADKDATDLELAIDAAIRAGHRHLILLGGRGGRIDHLLANALLLAGPRLADATVEWRLAETTVIPVRPGRPVEIDGEVGDTVSILPVGGPAAGLTTTGLQWVLTGDTLEPGSTRGISNEMTTGSATVAVRDGVALVVHERKP